MSLSSFCLISTVGLDKWDTPCWQLRRWRTVCIDWHSLGSWLTPASLVKERPRPSVTSGTSMSPTVRAPAPIPSRASGWKWRTVGWTSVCHLRQTGSSSTWTRLDFTGRFLSSIHTAQCVTIKCCNVETVSHQVATESYIIFPPSRHLTAYYILVQWTPAIAKPAIA